MRAALDATGRRTYAGEFRTVAIDGHIRWIDARGAVLFRQLGERPQCMVGIVVDISERKQREQQLQQTAMDLGIAIRMKDEFMATLAHELRNPLTPIRNGLEILELTGLAHPTQQRACSVMRRQLRHLVHLVDDLLDVSRVAQGKLRLRPKIVSVRTIVDAAVETISPQIEAAQHRLKIDIPETPVLLEVDPVRISQAIGNLLANSARYTPTAGGDVLLRAQLQGTEVEIEISDNGMTMSTRRIPPPRYLRSWVMRCTRRGTVRTVCGRRRRLNPTSSSWTSVCRAWTAMKPHGVFESCPCAHARSLSR
jgi:signal transduction histidine kinase